MFSYSWRLCRDLHLKCIAWLWMWMLGGVGFKSSGLLVQSPVIFHSCDAPHRAWGELSPAAWTHWWVYREFLIWKQEKESQTKNKAVSLSAHGLFVKSKSFEVKINLWRKIKFAPPESCSLRSLWDYICMESKLPSSASWRVGITIGFACFLYIQFPETFKRIAWLSLSQFIFLIYFF